MANEYKLVFKGLVPQVSEVRNIGYWKFSSPPTADDLSELETKVFDATLELIHEDCAFYGVDRYSWNVSEWQYIGTGYTAVSGAMTGDRMPMQVAIVMIGRTATKRTFGRKFLGPCAESLFTDGTVDTLKQDDAYACANRWYTPSTLTSGNIATPYTWSKNKGFHQVIGWSYDKIAGSMRRRKPGVGI